jgi:hypothetical protein
MVQQRHQTSRTTRRRHADDRGKDPGRKEPKNWNVRGERDLPHEKRHERAKGRGSATVVACEMGLKSADAVTLMWRKNASR